VVEQRELLRWIQTQEERSDGYARRYWSFLVHHRTEIRFEVDRCLDWHRSKGTLCSDWVATLRNWMRIACRSYLRKMGATIGPPIE
jgi:hypothetical protein